MLYVCILTQKGTSDIATTTVEAESIADACIRAKEKFGDGWEVTDAHRREEPGVPQEILKR